MIHASYELVCIDSFDKQHIAVIIYTYTYKGCFIWHVLMKHIYIQRLLYMTCTDEHTYIYKGCFI